MYAVLSAPPVASSKFVMSWFTGGISAVLVWIVDTKTLGPNVFYISLGQGCEKSREDYAIITEYVHAGATPVTSHIGGGGGGSGLTVSCFFSLPKYKTVRNRSLFRRVSIVSRN